MFCPNCGSPFNYTPILSKGGRFCSDCYTEIEPMAESKSETDAQRAERYKQAIVTFMEFIETYGCRIIYVRDNGKDADAEDGVLEGFREILEE